MRWTVGLQVIRRKIPYNEFLSREETFAKCLKMIFAEKVFANHHRNMKLEQIFSG